IGNPIENGELASWVSLPLLLSIEKTEMFDDWVFATYRYLPAGSMARISGCEAFGPMAARGGTSVKEPLLAMVNREISFSLAPPVPGFATYKNFPEGCRTT